MVDFYSGSGGGGRGATYDEAENTLRSMSVYRVLHLVSAGKIGGFPINKWTGQKDPLTFSYVDDVPIKYYDTTGKAYWNTGENIKIEWRDGSPSQSVIPGFAETGVSTNVGQTVTTVVPVVRSHGALADAVLLTVGLPDGLFNQVDNGIQGTSVNFKIQARTGSSGTWVDIHNITLNDKTTSYAELSYRVANPVKGSTWQTRLVRLTADNSSTRLKNNISYARVEELTINNSSYNNFALVGATADGKSFNSGSVPTQSFLLDGLFVKVPNVYTPGYYDGDDNYINPVYSGTWDGATFKNAITSNPVWVIYYLLTDTVNGLGDTVLPDDVDIYSFYSAAQYCDELITITIDGVSKQVPRFTFNWQFTTQESAIDVINAVASTFNARITYGDGKVGLVVDRPASATRIINPSSVVDGKFDWYSIPRSNRTTAVNATFYNRLNHYRSEVFSLTTDEYFGATADGGASYITNLGYNTQDIICVGAVDKQQAIRYARYMLEAALKQTEYVKFSMPLSGMDLQPGEVVFVDDPSYSGYSANGRVLAVGANYVDLDMAITAASGSTIRFTIHNGIRTTTLTSAATNATRVYVASVSGIAVHSEWSITSSIPPMRVVSIKEDGDNYAIEAKLYDAAAYTRIDTGVAFSLADNYRVPTTGLAAKPSNINVRYDAVNINGQIIRKAIVSWGGNVEYIKQWYLVYSFNGGQKISIEVDQPSITIDNIPQGFIEVWVSAQSINGIISDASYANYSPPATETTGSLLNAPTNVGVNGTGGLNFTTKDLVITWDNPSTNVGVQIMDTKIVVLKGSTVLRTVYVPFVNGQTRHSYTYTFEQNVADGGPFRNLNVNVQFRGVDYKLSAVG